MDAKCLVGALRQQQKFLMNVVKDFKPEEADFRPKPEMMTVAQQIRHIARTVEWFNAGVFGAGWEMDFEKSMAEDQKPCTLAEALAHIARAHDDFAGVIEKQTPEALAEKLPPNPILGEIPRCFVIPATGDHTAHHRGSLAVYLRLLGRVPTMPYVE